jgi:hypothetical protein
MKSKTGNNLCINIPIMISMDMTEINSSTETNTFISVGGFFIFTS